MSEGILAAVRILLGLLCRSGVSIPGVGWLEVLREPNILLSSIRVLRLLRRSPVGLFTCTGLKISSEPPSPGRVPLHLRSSVGILRGL